MNPDISKVRRDILLLITTAVALGVALVALISRVVLNYSLESARLAQRNYVIFGPILVGLSVLVVDLYLRPIVRLARACEQQETITRPLAQHARTVAFALPVYTLFCPAVLTFIVALISDLLSTLLNESYSFARHFPGSLLATIAAATFSLLVSVFARRLLAPVLMVTDGMAENRGLRLSIRRRQLAITLPLILIAIAFLGVLAYNTVLESATQGLRARYQLLGESAVQLLGPYLDEAALLKYVETLPLEEGYAFVVDAEGQLRTGLPAGAVPAIEPALVQDPQAGVFPVPGGEIVLQALAQPQRDWYLGFAYTVDPLRMPLVRRSVIIILSFAVGMTLYVILTTWFVAGDLQHSIRYVAQRLEELAQEQGVNFERLPVLSLDEVGELVTAFNQLQDKVQRQHQQLEQEQRELLTLFNFSQQIVSILDIDALLEQIIQTVATTFNYQNTSIFLIDEQTNELYTAVHAGNYDDSLFDARLKVGEDGVIGRAAGLGKPLLIPDVTQCEFYLAAGRNIQSELAVPMLLNGRVIGVFNVESDQLDAFSASDVRTLNILVNQAASAIHNAWLYRELEEQRQTAVVLAGLARMVNATLKHEEVMEHALEQLAQVITYDSSSILLDNSFIRNGAPAEPGLTIVAARGFADPQRVIGTTFAQDEEHIGHNVMRRQAVRVVPDVQVCAEWGHGRDDIEGVKTIRSWIGAPLVVQGHSIGTLTVDKHEPNFYNEEDGQKVANFAAQIAIALHNARLFESVQRQTQEMSALAESLEREKQKLNTILQNLADGLIVTARYGAIILVNPAFETLLQISAAILVDHNLHDVLPVPVLEHTIAAALDNPGEVERVDMPWGEQIFEVSAVALEDGSAVITLLRDVTREVELDRMKSEFISAVSHELRTPLTSILGFAKLTRRTFDRLVVPLLPETEVTAQVNARINRNVEIMVSEGERLTALINDVLDIAALDAGKIEWCDQLCEFPALVHRAAEPLRVLAKERQLEYKVEPAGTYPLFRVDPDRMEQVLTNLITNAIKFTPSGEVRIATWMLERGVSAHGWKVPDSGAVCVSVSDTGVGIAPEAMPNLFKRFRQGGDMLHDKPRGTGLGLAICHDIVSHYGGHIWAESELGRGSTFTFTLPVSPAVAAVPDTGILPAASVAPRNGASSAAKRATVLVVDDDPAIRDLLEQELTDAGYHVRLGANGAEAVAQVRNARPDLLVLDLKMPTISGFDVLRILKNDVLTFALPIIVCSVADEQERALALGADAYLWKPVDVPLLLETLAGLLHPQQTGA